MHMLFMHAARTQQTAENIICGCSSPGYDTPSPKALLLGLTCAQIYANAVNFLGGDIQSDKGHLGHVTETPYVIQAGRTLIADRMLTPTQLI